MFVYQRVGGMSYGHGSAEVMMNCTTCTSRHSPMTSGFPLFDEAMTQRINASVNQRIIEAMDPWTHESLKHWMTEPTNQRINESVTQGCTRVPLAPVNSHLPKCYASQLLDGGLAGWSGICTHAFHDAINLGIPNTNIHSNTIHIM